MFNKEQFKDLIERTLKEFNLYSESATQLLLGTAAQESQFGTYLRQITKHFNPDVHAMGVFQIEKNTFNWLRETYIKKDIQNLSDFLKSKEHKELEYNLRLSIIIARLRYYIVPEALPNAEDIEGLANYWKKYYNTVKG